MSVSSLRELGQFLAGPGALFNEPSANLLLGLGALGLTLTLVVVLVLRPLVHDVRARSILALIPFVALVSVLLVLLTQWLAQCIRYMVHARPSSALRSVGHGSWKQVLGGILFLIVAYIIGWGYSRSLESDSFGQHFLSFTVGTGVVEELVKGLAGLACIGILCPDGLEHASRRLILVAFTTAGLGFGAGEAVFYFQAYAGLGTEPGIYLLRGTWCVLLHGAWAFLTGLLLQFFHKMGERLSEGAAAAVFLACCLPAAIIHGLYDAFCLHSSTGVWTSGALSLGPCFLGLVLLRWTPESAESILPVPAESGTSLPPARWVAKGPLLRREQLPYALSLLSQGQGPDAIMQTLIERGLTREEAGSLVAELLMQAACSEAVDLLNQGKSPAQVEECLRAMGLDPEQAALIVRDIVVQRSHPQ